MSKKKPESKELALSPEHIKAIAKTEQVGTAMMETSQEFLIAIEEVLQREFNFDEEQLRHLEGKLSHMLVTLADVERKGLSVLSMHDMRSVGEIAQIREKRLQEKTSGVVLPEGVKRLN